MPVVKGIRYNVTTKVMEEYEEEVELPDPRIDEIRNRLHDIRIELLEGDWKTIKFMELGTESPEFIQHKSRRQDLRLEYNTLETELASLIAVSDLPL